MAIPDDRIVAFGELRGLLDAFAWFNNKTNYSPTFALDVLDKAGDVRGSLLDHFKLELHDDSPEIVLVAIDDWRSELRLVLGKWLFEYREFINANEMQVSGALNHEASQRDLCAEIVKKFAAVTEPTAVWRVHVKTTDFYETVWEDLAFENNERVYSLHMGMSD